MSSEYMAMTVTVFGMLSTAGELIVLICVSKSVSDRSCPLPLSRREDNCVECTF